MTSQVIRGDARCLPLADDSIDLIVTSPPYFALRSYTDGGVHYARQVGSESTPAEYVNSLIDCTREWIRTLKSTGSLWVNLGDKYSTYEARNPSDRTKPEDAFRVEVSQERARYIRSAPSVYGIPYKSLMGLPARYMIRCIDDLGLILRAEVIWSKPNGLPESVTDRVRRSHETWFHLVKQPRYFASVDAIREPHTDTSAHAASRRTRTDARLTAAGAGMVSTANLLGKLPGSVRQVPTQPLRVPAELNVDHFAAFPMEWPRWIISGWSPPNGMVLDPFGGTGTTALVADVLGRRGISVDYSADYCRLATWRTNDPGQRAAAMQIPKPAAEPADGQQFLFDQVN